jgi:transcriptional regulator with XRE-family HTH domain
MDEIFGQHLREARLSRGLTQEQLAERLGAGEKKHISAWENGHRDPTLSTIRRLASALGVSVSALVEEKE